MGRGGLPGLMCTLEAREEVERRIQGAGALTCVIELPVRDQARLSLQPRGQPHVPQDLLLGPRDLPDAHLVQQPIEALCEEEEQRGKAKMGRRPGVWRAQKRAR